MLACFCLKDQNRYNVSKSEMMTSHYISWIYQQDDVHVIRLVRLKICQSCHARRYLATRQSAMLVQSRVMVQFHANVVTIFSLSSVQYDVRSLCTQTLGNITSK